MSVGLVPKFLPAQYAYRHRSRRLNLRCTTTHHVICAPDSTCRTVLAVLAALGPLIVGALTVWVLARQSSILRDQSNRQAQANEIAGNLEAIEAHRTSAQIVVVQAGIIPREEDPLLWLTVANVGGQASSILRAEVSRIDPETGYDMYHACLQPKAPRNLNLEDHGPETLADIATDQLVDRSIGTIAPGEKRRLLFVSNSDRVTLPMMFGYGPWELTIHPVVGPKWKIFLGCSGMGYKHYAPILLAPRLADVSDKSPEEIADLGNQSHWSLHITPNMGGDPPEIDFGFSDDVS